VKRFKFATSKKGFTLIELVLYIGILSILLGVMSSIFTTVVGVQLESNATSSVDQDGRYLLSKLLYDVKSSSAIVTPANPGNVASSMQITINSINYTYSLDSNSNLQVVNNSTNEINVLNSYNTSVSNLTFTRIGTGGSSDTIRVAYTLTSRGKELANQQETKSYQTTLGEQ
jgi:prepilin-type N-terminal cleavage/methylation domain-containing protein